MEHISNIITDFIVKNMKGRGFSLYRSDENKILAIDVMYETCFKFDLTISDNDFSCAVLSKGEDGLVLRRHFNISWTNSSEIRDFMEFVRSL